MPLENGKWRVVSGDCLWNIARSVYGNGARWPEIAGANGLPQSGSPIIYPGQIFTIPGVTPNTNAVTPAPTPPPPITKPRIDWFSLVAGSQRDMQVVWSYDQASKFLIRWEQWDANGHLWMVSEQTVEFQYGAQKASEQTLRDDEGWNVCRFSVMPLNSDGTQMANTDWGIQEYDFRNNPPDLPPDPTVTIGTDNTIKVDFENIDDQINADSIEIAIYQDDTLKFATAKIPINTETWVAKYSGTIEPGHTYRVRCRAVRGTIYGGWTNFTNSEEAVPIAPKSIIILRPQVISEQGAKQYGVLVEWEPEATAKTYEVQWTTNLEYFDTPNDQVNSQTTEEGEGPRLLITNIEIGHEYFFRVRSINDKGSSVDWTPIKSVKLGSKPSAPTTWSSTNSAIIGEDLNLYWTHNSTDGSLETYARLHMTIIDSAHPDNEPMEVTKVIENTKTEEEQDQNSYYTINTNDDEWALLKEGFIIKWKVQTAGVVGEYSDYSIEREVNIYAKPSLTLDITDKEGQSVEEINMFPFHISVLAKPATQVPISYYIEIIANNGYETVDDLGNKKVINPGDIVYQKYYDPDINAWQFLLEMSPANIDLENNISYTVNVTVAMDSGLSVTESINFNVFFNNIFYDVYGEIVVDKETLTASIHPYCNEYTETEEGEIQAVLAEDCMVSVYRREYDGTFTEIAKDIQNDNYVFVTDPHPSLDYARYRVIAKSNKTGAVSFADIPSVKIGEPSVVIQWGEEWSNFDYDASGEGNIEPAWAGSMIKIPYNVDVSESKSLDVSLVEYAGRKHPVSYYGTQVGETAQWSVEVPKEDKDMIYQLRRLSNWMGDVYVREPNGSGYWANVSVSYNINHNEVTVPVSFSVTRVEGGM